MSKSIEELLKLIEEKPKSSRNKKEDSKNVVEFMQEFQIQSGTQAIPNYLIFYIYRCVWRVDEVKKKVKKITFFQTFSRHFSSYRKNHQRYYLLKEGLFDVTEDLLKTARQYDRQYWQSKKVQKKVSIPE